MPPEIEFRIADPAEEPARSLLAAMTVELDQLYSKVPGSLDSIPATPEQMSPPSGSFLLALAAGKPIACGGIKRIDASIAEIKRMYVVPAERGRGIAAGLLLALEGECSRLGYSRIRLDTGPDQPAAKRIYERAGYRSIPDYNSNPYAAHWFEKQLTTGPGGD